MKYSFFALVVISTLLNSTSNLAFAANGPTAVSNPAAAVGPKDYVAYVADPNSITFQAVHGDGVKVSVEGKDYGIMCKGLKNTAIDSCLKFSSDYLETLKKTNFLTVLSLDSQGQVVIGPSNISNQTALDLKKCRAEQKYIQSLAHKLQESMSSGNNAKTIPDAIVLRIQGIKDAILNDSTKVK